MTTSFSTAGDGRDGALDDAREAAHDDVRHGDAADALAHFWRAAHELLGAARSVIDAADELVCEQLESKRDDRPPRVRRIDVEER
jgi:hypothetical protein